VRPSLEVMNAVVMLKSRWTHIGGAKVGRRICMAEAAATKVCAARLSAPVATKASMMATIAILRLYDIAECSFLFGMVAFSLSPS
jgi:hypothetical protein